MSIEIKKVVGADLADWIDDLARLRIQVFREYPYLYDGTEAYERDYLNTYIHANQAAAFLALDGDKVIGASTGLPMASETPEFKQPFIEQGYNPTEVFYCGESVSLPEYRGRGIYKSFFHGRESHARELGGFVHICFCGVVRGADHPLRPEGYQPLDAVWRHFGYQPVPTLVAHYSWKDVDCVEETEHPMMFWLKEL